MGDRESRIRERAYQLWIEKGQPEGRADHHWDEASRLVDQEEVPDQADAETPAAAGEAAEARAARSRSGRKTGVSGAPRRR